MSLKCMGEQVNQMCKRLLGVFIKNLAHMPVISICARLSLVQNNQFELIVLIGFAFNDLSFFYERQRVI